MLDLTYDYNRNNSAGNLNGKTGHLTKVLNNLDHNKDREYQFDAVGRLTTAKGGGNGNLSQQQYQYDRFGNRTSVTATGVAADNTTMPTDGIPNLAFNSASNRIATAGYQYDSAGNQTRSLAEDGVTWLNYEYDAANRVRVIKRDDGSGIQAFVYGSTNARLIDYDAGVGLNKFYAGNGLVEYTEYGQNIPTWTKSYTYLGDSQLSTITPNGSGGESIEYNHPDRLGTRLITNQATGAVTEQAHLPFGKALNAESTITTNNKRFTSYDRSAATGLDYAVNRTYDSKQGRFTQVDPIGMGSVSLAAPQTLNLYAYCANDPINHTDPSGLGFFSFLKKLFKWIIAIIAVIVAILTIVAAPATLAAILGAISASASAGSSVASALGYTTAAKILGWIAIVTGIGAGLSAVHAANHSLIIKNFASTAEKTIPTWQRILGGISSVGALSNSYASTNNDDDDEFRGADLFVSQYLLDLIHRNNQSKVSDEMILCQVSTESHKPGDPVNTVFTDAAGSPNHRGLLQVSPEAAKDVGLGNGIRGTDAQLAKTNPDYIGVIYNAGQNLRTGTAYLQVVIDRAGGNIKAGYQKYRGIIGDAYYNKISKCAAKVKNGDFAGGIKVIYP